MERFGVGLDGCRNSLDAAAQAAEIVNVYTNNKFAGLWPVGTAAVVVAENAGDAAHLLGVELRKISPRLGDDVKVEDMELLPTNLPRAVVLRDGNY